MSIACAIASRCVATASATVRSSALMRSTISSEEARSIAAVRGLLCSVMRGSRGLRDDVKRKLVPDTSFSFAARRLGFALDAVVALGADAFVLALALGDEALLALDLGERLAAVVVGQAAGAVLALLLLALVVGLDDAIACLVAEGPALLGALLSFRGAALALGTVGLVGLTAVVVALAAALLRIEQVCLLDLDLLAQLLLLDHEALLLEAHGFAHLGAFERIPRAARHQHRDGSRGGDQSLLPGVAGLGLRAGELLVVPLLLGRVRQGDMRLLEQTLLRLAFGLRKPRGGERLHLAAVRDLDDRGRSVVRNAEKLVVVLHAGLPPRAGPRLGAL